MKYPNTGNLATDYHIVREWLKEKEAEIDRLKAERRWIPVSEAIPENDEYYPVIIKGHMYSSACQCDGHNNWYRYDMYGYRQERVTHWMPLPPKPEDE